MKKIKVNPLQARVKGNIIPDWEELLTKTSFEDFHVSREKANSITWQGRERSVVRLNSRGEPVILTVMSDLTSILPDTDTATLTIHATYTTTENNQTMTYPVQYQQVYIYDEDKLIATGATNSLGVMTFEYESSFSGIHELTIKTNHGNGFESASRKINIYVKYTSRLELSPVYTYDLGFGEAKELIATLYDSDNNVVADKPITFYEGYRNLGTYTTDKDGKARVMYMESANNATTTKIELLHIPTFYDGFPAHIKGRLTTNDGTPVPNKNVALFHVWSGYYLTYSTTDSQGYFLLSYIPNDTNMIVPYYVVYRSNTTDNEYITYAPTFTFMGDMVVNEEMEEHIIDLDINDWSYGKMNGTSVSDSNVIAPTVTDEELSTGRGNVVYYDTPLPSDLTEYTIRCKVKETRLYNRIGIATITENNNLITYGNNMTYALQDITGNANDNTTYELEFKFLNNVCYIYHDGNYTGYSHDYSNVSDDLYFLLFSNRYANNTNYPAILEELSFTDSVDLENIPTIEGAMIRTLDTDLTINWDSINSNTTNTAPIQNEDGSRDIGYNVYNTYNNYPVLKTTTNKTFVFKFNITQPYFRVGFINLNNTSNIPMVSHNTVNNAGGTVTSGDHTVVWIIRANGARKVYYDGTMITDSGPFSGNDSDEFALCLQNTNSSNTLTLESIKVYDRIVSENEITGGTV